MKQFISILIVCLLAACKKEHTPQAVHGSRISVIRDITDPLQCVPTADPILALYGFEHNKDQDACFRLVLITDKKLNPVEQIHIDDGSTSEQENINEEVDYREQLVYSFYDAVRKAIADFHKRYPSGTSLQQSECFATIANELELLAVSNAAQRTLIIFSDLQENTAEFSCCTREGQSLLQNSPGKVAKLLLKKHLLPANLQGISVYFVYNPYNVDQDRRFSAMTAIYQQLLHERGARVIIQATNKYYQL
jgi:hypothetical protein